MIIMELREGKDNSPYSQLGFGLLLARPDVSLEWDESSGVARPFAWENT